MSQSIAGVVRVVFTRLVKPVVFRMNPETVHDAFVYVGRVLGATPVGRACVRGLCAFAHPALTQTVCGVEFPNPVGLSAGFDKNARLTNVLPDVGFGFMEVGSVTGEPCAGNPKPRLWRLPKSQGIVVHYGLMNDGAERIAARLAGKSFRIPLGVSVAKTNSVATVDTDAGIADYEKAFRLLEGVADYVTVNISCPNAFGGEPFVDPERLEKLLTRLDAVPCTKPVFVKIPVDISYDDVDALLAVVRRHRVHGVVVANLTKRRDRAAIRQEELTPAMRGGISGKPTFDPSNALIAQVYRTAGDALVVVGSGGVFTAEDAYTKIRCGASLVQLITGMIFQGPQTIGEINRGLVNLLARDGFARIHEAVGVDARR